MGLFKPKGKHAQKVGGQPVVAQSDKADESNGQESVVAEVSAAQTAMPEESSSADAPSIRIEDFVGTAAAVGGEASAQAAGQTPAQKPAQPAVPAPIQAPAQQVGQAPAQIPPYPAGASPTPTLEPMMPAWAGELAPKKRNVGKILGITFGIIIGVLLIAYIAGAVVFMGRFFPNTKIGDNDISMMTNDEVIALLDNTVDDYTLDVVGTGFSYRTTASDIGLAIDSQAVVDAMHADLNAWTWPVLLFQNEHDESKQLVVSYKAQNYETKVTDSIAKFNESAVAPTDATISYDEATKKFKIVPEVVGTQYDAKAVLASMADAITTLNPKVKLTGDQLVQPKVLSTDERLVNSAELATGLVSAHVTLTMVGQTVADITGENLSQFIRIDENLGVTLDEAALNQWVTDLSNSFDTIGTERTYTRPDGKVITISGGVYGWATDAPELESQVLEAVKSGATTTIDIPCQQTAAVYNGKGQPDWGNRYIDVDLSEQYVRMYGDDGSLIWESACISGSPDGEHNTWPGVWYITNKQSPSKLIGYLPSGQKEYETTVSFWMAFEGNGIGLHDATWQPSFGGSMYANGYGSHGCVNLPYSAAESLYYICEVGDCVIAHY